MCIVLSVELLNVSVAFTSTSCAWILPLIVVLKDSDVAVSVKVITPAVETFTLSSLYADCVVNVIYCPSASVADNVPTVEPLVKNSAIVNCVEFIVGAVFGKNTDDIKSCTEPLVPKLLL